MSSEWPPLSPFRTGIRGRCPKCGEGHMFAGLLALSPRSEICDLDFSFADLADGPAIFAICFACVPSVFLGVWLEVQFQAAWWVHLTVTVPFMLATCILPLRPLKGWLVANQYFFSAEEGRIDKWPRSPLDIPRQG